MALSRCSFGVLLVLLPLQVPLIPDDSVSTSLQIIGSHGQYAAVSRSCEGDVLEKDGIPITEVAVSANHVAGSVVTLGIDGGSSRSKTELDAIFMDGQSARIFKRRDFIYAVPHVDLNAAWIGTGLGAVLSQRGLPVEGGVTDKVLPSAYLRLGKPRTLYFDISVLHNVSLTHGYFTVGLGSKSSKRADWWIGLSGFPYDGAGLLTRVDFRMSPAVQLTTSLRLGTSEAFRKMLWESGCDFRIDVQMGSPGSS